MLAFPPFTQQALKLDSFRWVPFEVNPTISLSTQYAMLKEIGNALIQSDVAVNLVVNLRKNIKNKVKLEEMAAGLNKRKIIKQVSTFLCVLCVGVHT